MKGSVLEEVSFDCPTSDSEFPEEVLPEVEGTVSFPEFPVTAVPSEEIEPETGLAEEDFGRNPSARDRAAGEREGPVVLMLTF